MKKVPTQFSTKGHALFYLLWILLGLWQAYSTDLLPDEAFYWEFSQQLAWGYMDHPPIVALAIKLGYALFKSELGVRFFFVIMSAGSIWIIRKIVEPNNDKLYYSIILSIAILHFEGFFAAPDGPLLFFGSLFVYVLKKFYENESTKMALLLGVAAALLMYSKYHGILIILFSVMANLRLLRTKYFWITFGTALLLYAPHIIWQISNHFPSLEFHLLHRGDNSFKIYHTINYVLSALIFFGPFTGFLFYGSVIKYETQNQFERSLKTIIYGTLIFYLLLTVRGNIEANWLLLLSIPMIYFGYNYIKQNSSFQQWHYKLFVPGLALIFVVRFLLAYDVLPRHKTTKAFNDKFHSTNKFVNALHQRLGEQPVVFMNSYRRPAIYHFYSGVPAITRRDAWARKTQYNTWEVEEKWRGKDVVAVMDYYEPSFDSIMMNNTPVSYIKTLNLQPSSTITIRADSIPIKVKPGEEISINLNLEFQKGSVSSSSASEVGVVAFFEKKGKLLSSSSAPGIIYRKDYNNTQIIKFKCPEETGSYRMYLGAKTNWLSPTINSEAYPISIEE